jgi:Tfp pilus assembly protein PilF
MDDYVSIVHNQDIRHLSGLKNIFTKCFFDANVFYRPLVAVSFMIEYHLFGLNPFVYNFTNLLLHVLSALGIYWVIRQLWNNTMLALCVAALFVIHPIHAEAVANIPGRSILLCAVFFFWSFYWFLLSRQENQRKTLVYAGSLVFFVLSLLSKESGAMLPFVLISYLLFVEKKPLIRCLGAKEIVPYYAALVLYAVIRQKLGLTSAFQWYPLTENILAVLTFLQEFLIYLWHALCPLELYYDRSARVFEHLMSPGVWITLMIWAGFITAALCYRPIKEALRDGKNIFLVSWVVINFFPVAQFVPIRVSRDYISAADHFMYIPSLAVFTVFVLFFRWSMHHLQQRGVLQSSSAKILGAAFYLFIFLMGLQQNFYNRQQLAMYKESLKHNPNNNRVRSTLATAYGISNLPEKAEKEFRQLADEEPWNAKYRIGLATALAAQDKVWESFEQYAQVRDPGNLKELYKGNLKILCNKIIAYYNTRSQTDAQNAQLFYSLGVMYFMIEQWDNAVAAFQRAIEFNPQYKGALHNLAVIYDMQEKHGLAKEYFDRSLAAGSDERLDRVAHQRLKFFEEHP